VNEMDTHLRELLEAAVGEPPHRVSVEAVRRRVIRRRVAEAVAVAVTVAVTAVIIPVGIGALGRASGPPPSSHPAARIVTSRHYGYTEALPAGWRSVRQAAQRWNGQGSPGDGDPVVDLFLGPRGVEAWAFSTPTKASLAAYTATVIRASHANHPCPVRPQTNQAITIGGVHARLLAMQCAPGSGFLVEIAVTVHHGTAFVFGSQNPFKFGSQNPSNADRAAFRNFLAGIRLPR
jgi:hypothetical protein